MAKNNMQKMGGAPAKAQVKGFWDQVIGKAKERWGNLTEDELMKAKGNVQQFLGYIERQTGESPESIREKLGWDEIKNMKMDAEE